MEEKPLYGSLYVSAQEIKYMIIIDRILFDEKERRLFHGNHSGHFYNGCLFSFPFYWPRERREWERVKDDKQFCTFNHFFGVLI